MNICVDRREVKTMNTDRARRRTGWTPRTIAGAIRQAFYVSAAAAAVALAAAGPSPACAQAAGGNGATAAGKQKLTIRFTWKYVTYYTPLFVALDRGYYAAEGLDVDLAQGSGAETVVQLIGNGTDKVAYGPATVAAEAASRGLPVMVVAVYMPKVPIGLISFPDVPLRTPKDLEGKTLGVSIGETFANMLVPFARINHVDLTKVKKIQLNNSVLFSQFINRKIDVMSMYLNDQLPLLEKRIGVKFNTINVADFGLSLLGQGFLVNDDFAKAHPEMIVKMLRATAKGYADTFKDPQTALQIMRKHMTGKIDPDVMAAQLKATLAATAVPKGKPLGWQDKALWQANLDLLKQTGRIKDIKALSVYYTNRFLQQAAN
jgi:NitT/TauT family transport system substrate-binding protein